jgi:hypothetical protein
MSQSHNDSPPPRQSLVRVFTSVVASMFGVQSSAKHQEDFGHGRVSTYVVVGLVMTVLFVLTVWGIVKLVVHLAQPT